ncbi:4-coumarate--CoA ligase-like 9 isoform X2 [Apium graveolens]|uniref:4-coumarate--CoA ligase-like 9 isoform X2 n=1 Tax=Apium graveolens TaxID=4045 RepID=UPI003D78F72A
MVSKLIDENSGFDYETQTYHSVRAPPPAQLADENTPLSITDYVLTLYKSNSNKSNSNSFLVDAATGHCLSFSQLQSYITTLSSSLLLRIGLSSGDTAFILSPNPLHVPLLYLSLFAIGVIVSPSNPASSVSEVSRQVQLTTPVIAFATSETAHILPSLKHPPILLDSPEFESLLHCEHKHQHRVVIRQSDTAAVLYSSGTTGRIKGVALTHRNLISSLNGAMVLRQESRVVAMCTVPLFHVYGFVYCIRCVAFGESLVVMNKFNLELMLKSIQQFRVTNLALVPPLIVAMINSPTRGYDLSSLQIVLCGAAPLPIPLINRFYTLLPNVYLVQAYGMTETTGGVFRTVGPYESKRLGANGRLAYNCQAKIVDPQTGIGLPPFKHGELWVRGPLIMRGYVHDEVATSTTFTADGWLRTADLCYFDNEGFLFYVDRLKELIKRNGYQVPPAELEDILQSHPDIVEAAVVPYPDEKAGQVPIAFVVRTPGSTIDESLIKEFVAKQVRQACIRKLPEVVASFRCLMSKMPLEAPSACFMVSWRPICS